MSTKVQIRIDRLMKVSDTPTGEILDWMVAKALGYRPAKREKRSWGYDIVLDETAVYSRRMISPDGISQMLSTFTPSHDASQAMYIADRYRVGVMPASAEVGSGAYAFMPNSPKVFGHNYAEAICRCLVIARLGESVEVPQELII